MNGNRVTYKVVAAALASLLTTIFGYAVYSSAQMNEKQNEAIVSNTRAIAAMERDIQYIRERVDRLVTVMEAR